MRLTYLFLLLIPITLTATTFRSRYEAGADAYQKTDYELALTNFTHAVNLATNSTDRTLAIRAKANAEFQLNLFTDALKSYQQIGETNLAHRCHVEQINQTVRNLNQLIQAEDFSAAELLARDFLQSYLSEPIAPEVAWNLYLILQLQGKYDDAGDVLNLYLKQWPSAPHRADALLARGKWHQSKKRYEQSVADYLTIGGELNVRRAIEACKQGHLWKRAATLITQYAPKDVHRAAGAWYEAATLFLRCSETNQAHTAFSRAVELAPQALFAPEANFHLALLSEAKGRTDEAIDLYQRVAEHSSALKAPEALWRCGRLLLLVAETNSAARCFGRLSRVFPRSEYGPRAQLLEAMLSGNEAGLRQVGLRAKDKHLSAEAWLCLGRQQWQRRALDDAERSLLRVEVLTADPSLRKEAFRLLAQLAESRGNESLGQQYLKRADEEESKQ